MSLPALRDRFARPLTSLRISVTDRCNMRCRYCMPEAAYVWLPRHSILTFEEVARLTRVFLGLGVNKIRLTGGEPLLRHGLDGLVRMLAAEPGIRDLALTTNGVLLAEHAGALRGAGLGRLTVSLDTLHADRLKSFARSDRHGDVLAGLDAARAAGFTGLKLNCVVIRGFNDDELVNLVEFGNARAAEVRFIEYMDVGGANDWRLEEVVPAREILARLGAHYGAAVPLPENASSAAPAERYRLPDGTVFGVIASTTEPFCRSCDRARLTADGHFLTCLYTDSGLDLREPLRRGASDGDLRDLIRDTWSSRADRGAEERAGHSDRGPLYQLAALRADPRREMHTRGG